MLILIKRPHLSAKKPQCLTRKMVENQTVRPADNAPDSTCYIV